MIIWAYLIVLPFVWSELFRAGRFSPCGRLRGPFLLGFVTLFGGLAAGRTGFGLADRADLDAIGVAVRQLPADARFAAFPTYNHPLLLQGRKVVLGYPGHVWTQGFNYGDDANKLATLMNGGPGWKETARYFRVRYLFWGRQEISNYAQRRVLGKRIKAGRDCPWGSI